jgi:hypothetical protein
LKDEDILIPDNVLRKLFKFAGLQSSDIFYDLGCGNSSAVAIMKIQRISDRCPITNNIKSITPQGEIIN